MVRLSLRTRVVPMSSSPAKHEQLFCSSFDSGDFNADGKTDLAVGANQYSSSTGRTYIFYNDGSPSRQLPPLLMSSSLVKPYDTFGGSLASRDFNADGKTDLAVVAYLVQSVLTLVAHISSTTMARLSLRTRVVPMSSLPAKHEQLASALPHFWMISMPMEKTDLAVGANGYFLFYRPRLYLHLSKWSGEYECQSDW
jgi:hypothetical protein